MPNEGDTWLLYCIWNDSHHNRHDTKSKSKQVGQLADHIVALWHFLMESPGSQSRYALSS